MKNIVKRKRVKKLATTSVESKNSCHKCGVDLAAELIQKETKIGFSANHAVFGFTSRAPKNAAFQTTTASLVNVGSRHYSVST